MRLLLAFDFSVFVIWASLSCFCGTHLAFFDASLALISICHLLLHSVIYCLAVLQYCHIFLFCYLMALNIADFKYLFSIWHNLFVIVINWHNYYCCTNFMFCLGSLFTSIPPPSLRQGLLLHGEAVDCAHLFSSSSAALSNSAFRQVGRLVFYI